MRVFRARSSVITSLALAWQLLAVIVVPTALCCRSFAVWSMAGTSQVSMADCPLHHEQPAAAEPSCPLHAAKNAAKNGPHECDCPTLGCSQTDKGFMALFGPIGVLPAATTLSAPEVVGDAAAVIPPSTKTLAPLPAGPPPRA